MAPGWHPRRRAPSEPVERPRSATGGGSGSRPGRLAEHPGAVDRPARPAPGPATTMSAMTPDALAALVTASINDLVERRRLHLPEATRIHAEVERPKNRDHGDYATTVAMTLAKAARTAARVSRRAAGRAAGAEPGDRAGRGRRTRLRQHHPGDRHPGRGRRADRRRGRPLRPGDQPGRSLDQHRVHLRQPDRTDPPGAHPLGGGRATPSPGCWPPRARMSPASSTSTTAASSWSASASRS